jgi:hypothetical protein
MALNIARYERKEDRRRLSRWLDLPCTKKPLAAPSAYGGFLRRYTTIPPSASPLAVHFATALSAKQHLQGRAIRSAMERRRYRKGCAVGGFHPQTEMTLSASIGDGVPSCSPAIGVEVTQSRVLMLGKAHADAV